MPKGAARVSPGGGEARRELDHGRGGLRSAQGLHAACQAGDAPSCEAIDRRFTRPTLLRDHDRAPRYTSEAVRNRLQGTWVATCRLGRDGRVGECRVETPTPELDESFLAWLRDAPYSPLTLDGRPFSLDYRFEFSLSMRTL